MSDTSQGEGWWIASDGKWYAPELHPDYVAPEHVAPEQPPAGAPTSPETISIGSAATPPTADVPASPGPTFTPAGATQTYDAGQPIDPDYNLPEADSSATTRRNIILGVGALVLLAGLGFLAVRLLNGGNSGTGAESPEAAVAQLIDSINEADAVGFVEIFDPDEIDAWFGSFSSGFESFEDVDSQGDPNNELIDAYASVLETFEYTLTGPNGEEPTFSVDELDPNGRISRVRVDGLDFAVSAPTGDSLALIGAFGSDPTGLDLSELDGTQVQLRDESDGLLARLMRPGEPTEEDFARNVHLDLVTVNKDGEWYISIGYSILEAARNQDDFPNFAEPDFGRAYDLIADQTGGAESAEQVVRNFFGAAEGLDYDEMIRLTDPLGTPYLHDYQPLIDAEVDQGDRREAAREIGLRFDTIELDESEWRGETLITFGAISGQVEAGSFEFDAATWCAVLRGDDERSEGCLDEAIANALEEIGSDEDPRDFLPEAVGVIVVERNGRWYVDPLGTLGFYTDQVSEAVAELTTSLSAESVPGFGEFVLLQGPIARQGQPARQLAESGQAGVAMDLTGFPTVGTGRDAMHVALARVTSTEPGTFLSFDEVPLTGADWVVVYEQAESDDDEYPAIVGLTDGELAVELFEVQVTEVGLDGHRGQLGGEGRPQVFVFADDVQDHEVVIEGVTSHSIAPWQDNGTVIGDDEFSPFFDSDRFTVIQGEPGTSFEITLTPRFSPPPPEPEQTPTPEFGLGDPIVDEFAGFVDFNGGYSYVSEQQGGYFDGCGPDDPDVITYFFEDGAGNTVLITPYPSGSRAQSAFDALLEIASPCEGFANIVVTSVEQTSVDSVRITWEFDDDPTPTFEHYRLAGNTIVVAFNGNVDDLEAQLQLLAGW